MFAIQPELYFYKHLWIPATTKGELTHADSEFRPMATPENLMAYEFSYFTN